MNLPRYLIAAAILAIAAPRLLLAAETSDATSAVREVTTRFQEAWNRHDMDKCAALMANDVVFIHVGGGRLNGRKEFRDYHTELHKAVMAQSVLGTSGVEVRLLRPDLAIVHWDWTMQLDQNRDGTPRPPREGIFTWLLERQGGNWLILEAQNTNKTPPPK